jgi:serine/threonine protein phosphatase 1
MRWTHYSLNRDGCDYDVGDIHGCFELLEELLELARFDAERDRLFCVGDLIDREPEPQRALEWLERP